MARHRVLVIKPSSLGDVVNGLVVVPRLRQLIPSCEIHWLVNAEYADVVAAAGVDRVLSFHRDSWRRWSGVLTGARNVVALSRALLAAKYDVALDLQGLFRSGWFTWITRAPLRIGFADARECARMFYNRRVAIDRHATHAVDCYLKTLEILGDNKSPAEWQWFGLDTVAEKLHAGLGTSVGAYFVFVLGARWKSKRWTASAFAETAVELWETYQQRIFLVGDSREQEMADAVIREAGARGRADDGILSLAGKINLVELIALCRDSRLVLTPDTGPMHCAVAAGAKVVALMGPTDPVRHGPYNQPEHVVKSSMPCMPCYRRRCRAKGQSCMEALTPAMVMQAVGLQIENCD